MRDEGFLVEGFGVSVDFFVEGLGFRVESSGELEGERWDMVMMRSWESDSEERVRKVWCNDKKSAELFVYVGEKA